MRKEGSFMNGTLKQLFCSMFLATAAWGIPAGAQETRIRVVDAVNLPGSGPEQTDLSWYIVFRETWTISSQRPGVQKTVNSYSVHDHRDPEADEDSLQAELGEMAGRIPIQKGAARLGDITYEFLLMDPDTEQTNNLHAPLAALVSSQSSAARHYKLEEQLLSVDFHERWSIDPDSLRITKKVEAVTPVIWQRRKTTDGEPVNDAESGLPVYYKIRLERIELRNP